MIRLLLLSSCLLSAYHTLCPSDSPNPGDACNWLDSCSYFEETCCGETYPSFICQCENNQALCYYTDACFGAFENCLTSTTPEPIFCTEDAMLCPDGSFVSRVPPDCEFETCRKGQKPQKTCGGFAGTECDEDYECLDDPRDDCDPIKDHGDCGGICMKTKKAKKEKKPKKAKEGDSCVFCYRPLCLCGLCDDGVSTSGCCGECNYKNTQDGLKCLFENTSTGCPEAAQAVVPSVISVESMMHKYIGTQQKKFVWFYLIAGLLVIGCICIICYCLGKKCKSAKYKYVDEREDSEIAKLNV